MGIIDAMFSQTEFKLMLWETLMRTLTIYAAVFTSVVLLVYLLLLGHEARK